MNVLKIFIGPYGVKICTYFFAVNIVDTYVTSDNLNSFDLIWHIRLYLIFIVPIDVSNYTVSTQAKHITTKATRRKITIRAIDHASVPSIATIKIAIVKQTVATK